ncbi:MAG: hypothetical protein ACR2NY_02875 [Alphaproteobacteria bacterium]
MASKKNYQNNPKRKSSKITSMKKKQPQAKTGWALLSGFLLKSFSWVLKVFRFVLKHFLIVAILFGILWWWLHDIWLFSWLFAALLAILWGVVKIVWGVITGFFGVIF